MSGDGKRETRHQAQHGLVARKHLALHALQALGARHIHQGRHKFMAQPPVLPLVRYHEGKFAGFRIRVGGVAGDPQLHLLAAISRS